jgi:transposase-like protein
VAEQRYEAVRAVIAGGETVTDVAARFGVARKTVHGWLAKVRGRWAGRVGRQVA